MATENDNTETPVYRVRDEALGHALRHRLGTESADDVIEAAEKYLAFLRRTD